MRKFQTEYKDYNFQEIYDTIKTFYPIEEPDRYTTETISSFPGFIEMSRLMEENFINQKNYRERWSKFNKHLKKSIKKPIRSTFTLSNCSYYGEVVLETIENNDYSRSKKLHFFISILGPYFSIYGIDSSSVKLPVQEHGQEYLQYDANHAVTVSPVSEYQTLFLSLEDSIREWFPGYLFIPYEIGMSTLKGISIEDEYQPTLHPNTIYEGMFGHIATPACESRGNASYGIEDWRKPLTAEEKRLADLISEHIITSSSAQEITLHKVWKLKHHNLLKSFQQSHNLFFGISHFDIIDLTDLNRAIVMEKNSIAPAELNYEIVNDSIAFPTNITLKIINLSEDVLSIMLHVDLQWEDNSVRGDLAEMEFEVMKKLV
ncbi:MAG TPA: hypothetical protein VIM65_21680 [Cyclobacteriaceae bacterium]